MLIPFPSHFTLFLPKRFRVHSIPRPYGRGFKLGTAKILIIIIVVIAAIILLAGSFFFFQPDRKIKTTSVPPPAPTEPTQTITSSQSGNPTVGNPLSAMATALSKRDGAAIHDLLSGTVIFSKFGTGYSEQKNKEEAVVKIFSILDSSDSAWDFSTTSAINTKIHDQVTKLNDTLVGNSAGSAIILSLNPDTGFFAVNSSKVQVYGL